MGLSTERKQEIIKEFGDSDNDTGSTEVQIALLTERINEMTEHLKIHPKDYDSKRGLEIMVSKRKRLLNYLRRKEYDKFKEVTEKLNLRV